MTMPVLPKHTEIVIWEGFKRTRHSVAQILMCGHWKIERNLNKHCYALLQLNLR